MTASAPGSALKWYGGKHYFAQKIVALFPAHHTYVEPYGGSAAVLVHKPVSPVEIYNDLDGELVNFFRVLRDHPEELARRLTLTPYGEAEFESAKHATRDPIERARRFLVIHRQSFGGRGQSFARSARSRSRRGMADNVSAWLTAIDDKLVAMVTRLRRVELSCKPAIAVIRKYDSPDTLFYCDPPYVQSTRQPGCRSVYAFEMSDDEHRKLAQVLRACRGKIAISGHPSALYDELYHGWHTVSFHVANHAAGGNSKKRRREQVWLNFPVRGEAGPTSSSLLRVVPSPTT